MSSIREQYNEFAKQCGFKSADEFLGYCVLHSMSERALFNGQQIGTAIIMAGNEDNGRKWLEHPNVWRSCDLRDLVDDARKLLEQGGIND